MSKTDRQVKEIFKRAVTEQSIPSEEITYTEMMENLAHARRQSEKETKP